MCTPRFFNPAASPSDLSMRLQAGLTKWTRSSPFMAAIFSADKYMRHLRCFVQTVQTVQPLTLGSSRLGCCNRLNLSLSFLHRDAGEDEGGGLNGALAVERLERFERPFLIGE